MDKKKLATKLNDCSCGQKTSSLTKEEILSCEERVLVEEHERLSPHLLFQIICKDGDEELSRPTKSLIFSGIAAGIIISFSFVFKAVLAMYLPEAAWTELITSLGYSVGFIIVILGRMQLFTENTITTVIPFFNHPSISTFNKIIRLWGLVFIFNIIGTALAAWFLSSPLLVTPELESSLQMLSHHVADATWQSNIVKGVPSGILIAALVWMLPMSRNFSFFLIMFFTYFISLGGFAHVVVGSSEMAYIVIQGGASLADYFFKFLIPTGLGNIIGGTGVFTLLVYAQVKGELSNHTHETKF